MKLTKTLAAAFAVCSLAGLTSCDTDTTGDNTYTVPFTFELSSNDIYNEDGYWSDVYNGSDSYTLIYASSFGVAFSHSSTYYEAYDFYSWYGFCPSRATETQDVSAEADMTAHQWSSVTGSGANSTDYLVCYWNCSEDTTGIPADPSLKITIAPSAEPLSVYVANSNYAYWIMKNGNYYSTPFDDQSWFKVIFYGVKDNQVTGKVEQYLAQNGTISNSWIGVDLSSLGTVDYMYVQMESSDTGTWGMNTPAYFCLDNLAVKYTY